MKKTKKKLMNDIKRGQVGKEKCKKRNTKEIQKKMLLRNVELEDVECFGM